MRWVRWYRLRWGGWVFVNRGDVMWVGWYDVIRVYVKLSEFIWSNSCELRQCELIWIEFTWGGVNWYVLNWCKRGQLLSIGFIWDELICVEFSWGRVNVCGRSLCKMRWRDVRWIDVRWDGMRRGKIWQDTVDHFLPNSHSQVLTVQGCVRLSNWLSICM